MHVAAFHGDFAQPQDLRDDAGNPDWIDEYPSYERITGRTYPYLVSGMAELRSRERLVLVGYSRGGDVVAWLSTQLTNIVGAILYESPVLSVHQPGGNFPAALVWNRYSRKSHSVAAEDACYAWGMGGRHRTLIWGDGKHTRRIWRPRTLFRAHGWDVELNPLLANWVAHL